LATAKTPFDRDYIEDVTIDDFSIIKSLLYLLMQNHLKHELHNVLQERAKLGMEQLSNQSPVTLTMARHNV
jgi:hypothetical protein